MAPGTFALGHFQPTAGGSAGVEPGSQKIKNTKFPGNKGLSHGYDISELEPPQTCSGHDSPPKRCPKGDSEFRNESPEDSLIDFWVRDIQSCRLLGPPKSW